MRVSEDVLTALSRCSTDGPRLVLAGQLDRKLYERTSKVIEAAGGKWSRSAKAHVFESDASAAIEGVLLTGEILSAKKEFGFFETTEDVLERLFDLAEMETGLRVLEPSAGRGAIIIPLIEAYRPSAATCYELQESNIDKLDMRVCNATSEYASRDDFPVIHGDFLASKPRGDFDRVVMNPPFAAQADIDHVSHALQFLVPGGMLVSVMSAGVAFREDRKAREFRALVTQAGGEIERLPEGSFRPSGTDVNTVIVKVPN